MVEPGAAAAVRLGLMLLVAMVVLAWPPLAPVEAVALVAHPHQQVAQELHPQEETEGMAPLELAVVLELPHRLRLEALPFILVAVEVAALQLQILLAHLV